MLATCATCAELSLAVAACISELHGNDYLELCGAYSDSEEDSDSDEVPRAYPPWPAAGMWQPISPPLIQAGKESLHSMGPVHPSLTLLFFMQCTGSHPPAVVGGRD